MPVYGLLYVCLWPLARQFSDSGFAIDLPQRVERDSLEAAVLRTSRFEDIRKLRRQAIDPTVGCRANRMAESGQIR